MSILTRAIELLTNLHIENTQTSAQAPHPAAEFGKTIKPSPRSNKLDDHTYMTIEKSTSAQD
jgi:hypothetical protein